MQMSEIRRSLISIADHPDMPADFAWRIRHLAEATRKRSGRKGPSTSRRMTPQLRIEILNFVLAHPEQSQFQIAQHFGVNQGRVSEIVHGYRD